MITFLSMVALTLHSDKHNESSIPFPKISCFNVYLLGLDFVCVSVFHIAAWSKKYRTKYTYEIANEFDYVNIMRILLLAYVPLQLCSEIYMWLVMHVSRLNINKRWICPHAYMCVFEYLFKLDIKDFKTSNSLKKNHKLLIPNTKLYL